jgi:hypothetical protein
MKTIVKGWATGVLVIVTFIVITKIIGLSIDPLGLTIICFAGFIAGLLSSVPNSDGK